MDLPLLCALFVAFALALYVMLDGFDLGVGALLLLAPGEAQRDRIVASIAPTWDGNETWLIMAGVGLLAAFPTAYAILLPAFYVPLVLMLLSLGLRGVCFEFRAQVRRRRWAWDAAFAGGSVLAAFLQGVVVGGLVQGVAVRDGAFAGSPFDVFSGFSLLTGAAVLAGYATLGSGWLFLKEDRGVRLLAARVGRAAAALFFGLAALVCASAAQGEPAAARAWSDYPWVLGLLVAVFVIAARRGWHEFGRRDADAGPFAAGLVMFAAGLGGLGLTLFPAVVPFELTIWQAASSPMSQELLLAGATVVTPVVLAYSAFAYWVFRGKTPARGWE